MWKWNRWFYSDSDSRESPIPKFLEGNSCGFGISDSLESVIPWNHWFWNFGIGFHFFNWFSSEFGTHIWWPKDHLGPNIVQFWPNLSSICMATQARFLSFVNCIVFQIENCWNRVVRNLILVENNSPKIMESVIPGYQWFPSISDSKTTWVPFQKFWNRWCPRISDSLESLIPFWG